MKRCTRAFALLLFLFSLLLVGTSLAHASPGTLQLSPPSGVSFGEQLRGTSYLLEKTPLRMQLGEQFGVMQQSFGDPGAVILLVLLPSIAGSIAVLVGIIGGAVALHTKRGQLGWGIYNLILATGSLAMTIATFAFGMGLFGAIFLFITAATLPIGVVNVYQHATRSGGGSSTPAYHDVGSSSMAAFRFRGLSATGVTFSL